MKYSVLLMIGEGKQPKIEAVAFSKTTATIYVTAETIQDAAELIKQGEDLAADACRIWEPAEDLPPVEEIPQKHYKLCPIAKEDIEEYLANYTENERGRRFLKSLENAKAFTRKMDKGSMRYSDFMYFITLVYKDAWDGVSALYDYAYRRGYNRAKARK